MRKAAKQILACMLILVLCCVACRIFLDSPLNLHVPLPASLREDAAPAGIRVSVVPPETVRAGEPEIRGRVAGPFPGTGAAGGSGSLPDG